jgi:Proteasome non-ATPase 26S subunit
MESLFTSLLGATAPSDIESLCEKLESRLRSAEWLSEVADNKDLMRRTIRVLVTSRQLVGVKAALRFIDAYFRQNDDHNDDAEFARAWLTEYDGELLTLLLGYIRSEHGSLASLSAAALRSLFKGQASLMIELAVENDAVASHIDFALQGGVDSTVQMRILTLLFDLAACSERVHGALAARWRHAGVLAKLIGNADDVLTQMSALELLPDALREPWMCVGNDALLAQFSRLFVGRATLSSFLTPVLIGVLARLAELNGLAIDARVVDALGGALRGVGDDDAPFAPTVNAAAALLGTRWSQVSPSLADAYLKLVVESAHAGEDRQCAFFGSLEHVFRRGGADTAQALVDRFERRAANDDDDDEEEPSSLLNLVMDALSRQSTRQRARVALLSMLNAYADHAFGADQLICYPGMADFMCDRNTELTAVARRAKYDTVVLLFERHRKLIDELLDADEIGALDRFLRSGPFFSSAAQARASVADSSS